MYGNIETNKTEGDSGIALSVWLFTKRYTGKNQDAETLYHQSYVIEAVRTSQKKDFERK